jgi:HEAT repeat protein
MTSHPQRALVRPTRAHKVRVGARSDGPGTRSLERQEAVWVLGLMGGEAAVVGLREALHDPDVEVRREAVWALARLAGPAVMPVLEEARHDSDLEVRSMAAEVLRTIRRKHACVAEQPTSPALSSDNAEPPSGPSET